MKQIWVGLLLCLATTSAFSQIDSMIGMDIADNYLEGGTDQDLNWGGKSFLRIKSGNQGITIIGWDMSLLFFTPMAGNLIMSNSNYMGADTNPMSYTAVVAGITCDWFEGAGVSGSNDPTGSCFHYQTGTTLWPNGTASMNFAAQMAPVQYSGKMNEQELHVFPVSGAILQGLMDGTYKGIAIYDQGTSYTNNHFWSKESGIAPILWCYSQDVHAERNKTAAIRKVSAFPNPFNPATTLQFAQPVSSAGLVIFNMSGKVVADFNNISGNTFSWDASAMPSGAYIAKLTENSRNQSIKLILQK